MPAELLQSWMQRKNGLILITGPTGSGKSTTVASMVQEISNTRNGVIITLPCRPGTQHLHKGSKSHPIEIGLPAVAVPFWRSVHLVLISVNRAG